MITPIEGIDSSSRVLRASIYLRTSLEKSAGQVQDLLDCVVPIVKESIKHLPEGQIVVEELGKEILDRFSFRMPAFTIELVLARLAKFGKVTYDHAQQIYIHRGASSVVQSDEEATVNQKIRHLERKLSEYAAKKFGINSPIVFASWSDVIVYFLHPDSVRESNSVKQFKGFLLSDFDDLIRRVVSAFILHCESSQDIETFEILVKIYGGILLGDFLQNIQSTGNPASFKALTVYYDTTVLLRLLGCSGPELYAATMEMHRDLQSLGCKTKFLANNETELCNILDTIVSRFDAGQLIYGETGEALGRGKEGVQIGVLRELVTAFPEKLGVLNIFPSKYTFENTKTQNYYQIDEIKFQELLAEGKGYGEHNLVSDAKSLAVVMRLRQSSRARDVGKSKFVFITANSHLARTARRFVKQELARVPQYVPPILTHSQMCTVAWFSNELSLPDSKITQELLINCMSAQKLSREWVDIFAEKLKTAEVPEEDYTIINVVRAIARDDSLGNPTILKKLNLNDMLSRAKDVEEERVAKLKEQHLRETEKLTKKVEITAREKERRNIVAEQEKIAEFMANKIVRFFEIIFIILSFIVFVKGFGNFDAAEFKSWIQSIAFSALTLLAILDLFEFRPVSKLVTLLRLAIKKFILRIFYQH